MEKRYGLDAISYLTDPPSLTGETSQWQQVAVKERRQALQRGIALKRRELADLNLQLSMLGDEETAEYSHPKPSRPGPIRWLMRRLLSGAQ